MQLVICLTFHYVECRRKYLHKAAAHFPFFADQVELAVFTNTSEPEQVSSILDSLPRAENFSATVHSIERLSHPYMLTWAHKNYLRYVATHRRDVDAFMYTEDDIEIRPRTLAYWFAERETLRPFGLYPSFFRVEKHPDTGSLISVDIEAPMDLSKWPRAQIRDDLYYYNFSNAYQGMYVFDRELMEEHLQGPAVNPTWGPWDTRENAAQGQAFVNIPNGFEARNVFPVNPLTWQLDPLCLVYHLPNNYVQDPASRTWLDINGNLFTAGT